MKTLFNEQQALHYIKEQLQHWQLTDAQLQHAFQYVVSNGAVHVQQLAQQFQLHEASVAPMWQQLFAFQVGANYYMETMYVGLEHQCERKFLHHTKAILQQQPLQSIPELFRWLQYYIEIAERHYTTDEVCAMLLQLLQHLQKVQAASTRLKMTEIVVLLYCFKSGERYYRLVVQKIATLKRKWRRGKLALTAKERTLLAFVTMTIAHHDKRWKKVVDEARYLLKQDRFMDVAVELIIDYGSLLGVTQPEPNAFIKKYRKSVFETFFFMYIEALTQLNKHKEALNQLLQYEIATTTTIYAYLQQPSKEALIAIEAAVQQNIALLMDGSVSYVKQSLVKWQAAYAQMPEAQISSKYMCMLLETLFISEQYELFDCLMSIYLKYLSFEQHYASLKERISTHMALQTHFL